MARQRLHRLQNNLRRNLCIVTDPFITDPVFSDPFLSDPDHRVDSNTKLEENYNGKVNNRRIYCCY